MLSVTKIFRFEAAHALSDYPGQCRNIHGHSYELHVSVSSSELKQSNMIIDFKELKEVVQTSVLNDFDHALILKNETSHSTVIESLNLKVVLLEKEPTAEYLVNVFAGRILKLLPSGIELHRIRLHETNTCYVDWTPDIKNF
jgi:6-pyruvoyltetrahydropterin/6-carboxytetrahydropterin synthase